MTPWGCEHPCACSCIEDVFAEVQRLRSAIRSAELAAYERAAREVEIWSLPTIQTPSMWLIDKAGIAAAIRALAEQGGQPVIPAE
jgi:hypothetical protein